MIRNNYFVVSGEVKVVCELASAHGGTDLLVFLENKHQYVNKNNRLVGSVCYFPVFIADWLAKKYTKYLKEGAFLDIEGCMKTKQSEEVGYEFRLYALSINVSAMSKSNNVSVVKSSKKQEILWEAGKDAGQKPFQPSALKITVEGDVRERYSRIYTEFEEMKKILTVSNIEGAFKMRNCQIMVTDELGRTSGISSLAPGPDTDKNILIIHSGMEGSPIEILKGEICYLLMMGYFRNVYGRKPSEAEICKVAAEVYGAILDIKCSNCGSEISPMEKICPSCQSSLNVQNKPEKTN